MTEYEDAKWVAANRNIVVVGQSRSEDEVFLIPNGVYDLYKSRGLVRDAEDPSADAPEPEPEPEAEASEEPQPDEAEEEGDQPEPEEEREADEGEADEDGVPEWDLQMDPDTYIRRYPDGDHAEKAKAVLEARGEEIPEEA